MSAEVPALIHKTREIQTQTFMPHESPLVFHPDLFDDVKASEVFPDLSLHELEEYGATIVDREKGLLDLKKITTAGGLTGGGGAAALAEVQANAQYAEQLINQDLPSNKQRAVSVLLNAPEPLPPALWSEFKFREDPNYNVLTYPIPRYANGQVQGYKDMYEAYAENKVWQNSQLQHLRKAGKALILEHFWHGGLMETFRDQVQKDGVDMLTLFRNHSLLLNTVQHQNPEYFRSAYLNNENKELTEFRMEREMEGIINSDFNVFTTLEEAETAAEAIDGSYGFTKERFMEKALVIPIVVKTDSFSPDPEIKRELRKRAFKRYLEPLGAQEDEMYMGGFYRRDWKEKGIDILLQGYLDWITAKGKSASYALPNLIIAGGLNSKPGNKEMEEWADYLIANQPEWIRKKIFNIKTAIPNTAAYALKDIAVYASPEETLGIAQIEDRAGGIPVILNWDAMGHRAAHPTEGTVFFQTHDKHSLLYAFDSMLDPNLRKQVSRAGIKTAEQFSPQSVATTLFSKLKEKREDFFTQ